MTSRELDVLIERIGAVVIVLLLAVAVTDWLFNNQAFGQWLIHQRFSIHYRF